MKSAFVSLFAFLPVIAIARNKPRQEETLKPECVRAVSLETPFHVPSLLP